MNDPKEQDTPDDFSVDESSSLKQSERWLSGALGTLFAAAGVAATFFTKNQAGTTALIIVSGILVFLATTGTPIIRAKYGDKEIEFSKRRGRAVADAVKDEPEEVAERAVNALEQVDPVAAIEVIKARSSMQERARAYELRLEASLLEIISNRQIWLARRVQHFGFDFQVEKNGEVIGIEAKYTHNGKVGARVVYEVFGAAHANEVSRAIIISNVEPTLAAQDAAAKSNVVTIVHWRGPGDDAALAQALEIEP
ncbi:restriction endonuclease [Actinomadura montaniterrae]|uniref:Restriction endonuclease n=1 Tax=Actinomadura montaniterrae TaxID=1803903 RepID=A0A6L3WER6_9ACTN|nr:restriction endonuclease [Actinomadura montaniterrae]KAB2390487.1 restriction endonuclease [Actinomadura montaniterrae]